MVFLQAEQVVNKPLTSSNHTHTHIHTHATPSEQKKPLKSRNILWQFGNYLWWLITPHAWWSKCGPLKSMHQLLQGLFSFIFHVFPLHRVILADPWCVAVSCREWSLGDTTVPWRTIPAFTPVCVATTAGSAVSWAATKRIKCHELEFFCSSWCRFCFLP